MKISKNLQRNKQRQKRTNRTPRQLSFIPTAPKFFGGQLLDGKRRGLRPLSSQEALHVVIRASRAMGDYSFLAVRNRKFINNLLFQTAAKYRVRVYRHAIVGNHCHLIIEFPHRRNYLRFVRVFTGRMASHVMKNQSYKLFLRASAREVEGRGDGEHRKGKGQKFFNFRPFTRILNWGRDFKNCSEYLLQNKLEALGCLPYRPRSKHPYVSILNERFSSA